MRRKPICNRLVHASDGMLVAIRYQLRADLVIGEDWLWLVQGRRWVRAETSLVFSLVLGALNLSHQVCVDGYSSVRLAKHVIVLRESWVKGSQ